MFDSNLIQQRSFSFYNMNNTVRTSIRTSFIRFLSEMYNSQKDVPSGYFLCAHYVITVKSDTI